MDHFRVILKVLKEHQLLSKYNICEFLLRLMACLGHIISSEGIEVNTKKTEVVKNWLRPLTPTDIRNILGLSGYYKRFVYDFSSIASRLTTLTQKSVKFEWLEACERRFQVLKDRLTCALAFTLLESTKGFVVYCDASWVSLGYVLMQYGKVVTYACRQLKVHEKNYLTHDLKLVVIMFDLKMWRHYRYGVHVDVYTIHKSLQYVFTLKEFSL